MYDWLVAQMLRYTHSLSFEKTLMVDISQFLMPDQDKTLPKYLVTTVESYESSSLKLYPAEAFQNKESE